MQRSSISHDSFNRNDNIAPAVVHEGLRSPGQPLDADTRAFFEPRFGRDFSHVRLHSDAKAAESARELNARAYSVGQDIVFGAGQYATNNREARGLLAHELIHTIQQPRGAHDFNQALRLSSPADASEREATRMSEIVRGESPPDLLSSNVRADPGVIHRDHPPATPQRPATLGQQPNPTQQQTPAPADLRTQVRHWLDQQHFGLPLVADPEATASGARHVHYSEQRSTLDAVTNDVTDVLGQTTPDLRRPDVWSQVWQYYNEKKAEAERERWQTLVQVLYTPQVTFASTQPSSGSPVQHGVQISIGRNLRLHPAGASGAELTFQANVSLFNLGSRHGETGDDAFQNATLSKGARALRLISISDGSRLSRRVRLSTHISRRQHRRVRQGSILEPCKAESV